MAYQPNIPLAGDLLKNSQADIEGNFQAIKALIDINHVTFGGADQGKHNFVTLPVQAAAPAVFLANEGGLWNRVSANTGKSETYVRKPIDGGTDNIPFTASKLSNNAAAVCDAGWSYLPSGLLIKWGDALINVAHTNINTQPFCGGPNYTRVFQILITPRDTSANTNFNAGQNGAFNIATSQIPVYANNFSGTTGVSFLIIGV